MAEILPLATYRKADEIMRICRTAVRKAQEESRRLGVANVYTINGQRYYELPNGDYSRTPPPQREG
jgi:hypothetical protein